MPMFNYEVRVPLEWMEDVEKLLEAVARKRRIPFKYADIDEMFVVCTDIVSAANDTLDEMIIDVEKRGKIWVPIQDQ